MSRVGKVPVKLTAGVKVDLKSSLLRVEGPKGKLEHRIPSGVVARIDGGTLHVEVEPKRAEEQSVRALHGLTRTIIHNMVHGVSVGFSRELDIVGVGYRAATKGSVLTLTVGYSHQIDYELPAGVNAKVENNTRVIVSGADKVLVGMVAAKIRGFRPPEPYQGKGIKYVDEHIIRKQGKAAGAK